MHGRRTLAGCVAQAEYGSVAIAFYEQCHHKMALIDYLAIKMAAGYA